MAVEGISKIKTEHKKLTNPKKKKKRKRSFKVKSISETYGTDKV